MFGFRPVLAVLAIVLSGAAVRAAAAAELDVRLVGSELGIAGPCAAHVVVRGGPAAGIAVQASAEHREEIDQLVVDAAQGRVSVRRRDPNRSCWRPAGLLGWRPTLVLSASVPASTAIALNDGGGADDRIGGVGGRLALSLSADAAVDADAVTSLEADLSGTSRVTVGRADGRATLDLSGAGRVTIGTLRTDRLAVDASGRSAVEVGAGTLGALEIDGAGGSVVSIGATVSDASVSAAGAAAVRLARVTGPLRKDVGGGASVVVLH